MSNSTMLFDELRKIRGRSVSFDEYFRSFTNLFASSLEKYSSQFGLEIERKSNGDATNSFIYLGKKVEFFQVMDFSQDRLQISVCIHCKNLEGKDYLKEVSRFEVDNRHVYSGGESVGDLIGLVDVHEFSMHLLLECANALSSEIKL